MAKHFRRGEAALIIGILLYLTWWTVRFRAGAETGVASIIMWGLLAACAVLTVVGACENINGMIKKDPAIRITDRKAPSCIAIGVAGGVVSAILIAAYAGVLHGELSVEIILFPFWAVLHLCMISKMYRADACDVRVSLLCALFSVIAAAAELFSRLHFSDGGTIEGYIFGLPGPVIAAAMMCILFSTCMFYEFREDELPPGTDEREEE